nr:glycine-rich cell wall structural protein 1-like [Arachis hypogaea]
MKEIGAERCLGGGGSGGWRGGGGWRGSDGGCSEAGEFGKGNGGRRGRVGACGWWWGAAVDGGAVSGGRGVLEKEHPGRVRGLGMGVVPTVAFKNNTTRISQMSLGSSNNAGTLMEGGNQLIKKSI